MSGELRRSLTRHGHDLSVSFGSSRRGAVQGLRSEHNPNVKVKVYVVDVLECVEAVHLGWVSKLQVKGAVQSDVETVHA